MQSDSDDIQARAAREAELSEVLSSYADPRAVSYRFVSGFVLLGLVLSASVALAGAHVPRTRPFRLEPAPPASFQRGVAAYERGDWDEALKGMREAQNTAAQPVARVDDYLERLELIRQDGDRLLRAEEAFDADEPERSLVLSALVAPNSPLFAQAEGLGRKARARMELDMRTEPLVRAEPTVIDPQPEPPATLKKRRLNRPRVSRVQEPSYEGEW